MAMIRRVKKGIVFYQFESFDGQVPHAVFTRRGGVSNTPWDSLNTGATVGDDPAHVMENRKRALKALDQDPNSVFDVWQIHSSKVVVATKPQLPHTPHVQADGILTSRVGITLMMRFADCVPLFFYDPVRKVVGIAHAGWQGTVKGIGEAMVKTMETQFDSRPNELIVGIGPSIGPDHYEVGFDVFAQAKAVFEKDVSGLFTLRNGKLFFDLWTANRFQLEKAGVKSIEVSSICTACNTDDWFSHRAERGRTGRFCGIVSL